MKIKKGDNVIILSGKDKGKQGKVLESLPQKDRVIVEGVNILKKHQRSRQQGKKGEVIEKTMPIHVSNVSLMEKGKAVRVGYKMEGDKKIRISKKSNQAI